MHEQLLHVRIIYLKFSAHIKIRLVTSFATCTFTVQEQLKAFTTSTKLASESQVRCLENGSIYQKLELGRDKELAHHSAQPHLSQMFSLLPTLLAFCYHLQPNLLDGKDGKAVFSTPFSTFTNLGLVSTWMNEGIQECSAFSCC